MSEDKVFLQKIKNTGRTIALFTGMLALMAGLGYSLLGTTGIIWAAILGAITLGMSMRVPTQLVMRMQGARPLRPYEAPDLWSAVQELSRRAGLKNAPRLYYLPAGVLNAFASGQKHDPAIAVTQGLLSRLSSRELTSVLAHEISHLRNGDLQLKSMVNIISRLTRTFSLVGQLLLLINLPLLLMGEPTISWVAILLLLFAPSLTALMVMAFSRTREFEADRQAAQLTGDPMALSSALQKLDYYNDGGWLPFFRAQRRMKLPSLFLTHPTTEERVQRLRELAPKQDSYSYWPEKHGRAANY